MVVGQKGGGGGKGGGGKGGGERCKGGGVASWAGDWPLWPAPNCT